MRYASYIDGADLPNPFTLLDLPRDYLTGEYKISEAQAQDLSMLLNPNQHWVKRVGLGYRIETRA